MLDEFDLARLGLSEEKKNQFKQLDISIDKLVALVNGLDDNKVDELERLSKELSEKKPVKVFNNKSWKKNKFYE